MMSKERLEELLDDLAYIVIHSGKLEPLKQFAREQAELVRELERQNKALELEVDGWFNKANEIHESMLRQDKVIDKFRQQNKYYREIIQDFIDYADDYNIAKVEKYHLRKALEESK